MCPAAAARVPRGPRPQREEDEQGPGRCLERVGGRGWGVLRRLSGNRPGGREDPVCPVVAAGGRLFHGRPYMLVERSWELCRGCREAGPFEAAWPTPRPSVPGSVLGFVMGTVGADKWPRAGIYAVDCVRPMTSTTSPRCPGRSLCDSLGQCGHRGCLFAGCVDLGAHVRPPCLPCQVRFGCGIRSCAAASLTGHAARLWAMPSPTTRARRRPWLSARRARPVR